MYLISLGCLTGLLVLQMASTHFPSYSPPNAHDMKELSLCYNCIIVIFQYKIVLIEWSTKLEKYLSQHCFWAKITFYVKCIYIYIYISALQQLDAHGSTVYYRGNLNCLLIITHILYLYIDLTIMFINCSKVIYIVGVIQFHVENTLY